MLIRWYRYQGLDKEEIAFRPRKKDCILIGLRAGGVCCLENEQDYREKKKEREIPREKNDLSESVEARRYKTHLETVSHAV